MGEVDESGGEVRGIRTMPATVDLTAMAAPLPKAPASRWASTRSRANSMDDDSHHHGDDSSDQEEDGIEIALNVISPILLLSFG